MRRDPIEIAMAAQPRRRRAGARSPRETKPTAHRRPEHGPVAPPLLDEAFAMFASDQERARQADAPRANNDLRSAACEALSAATHADSLSYSQRSTAEQRIERQRKLVDNLSAQLAALDRQREHLARLLQDIDTGCDC